MDAFVIAASWLFFLKDGKRFAGFLLNEEKEKNSLQSTMGAQTHRHHGALAGDPTRCPQGQHLEKPRNKSRKRKIALETAKAKNH